MIQYLRLLSAARVIVVERSQARRERAVRLGAHEAAGPGDHMPAADVIFDVVGTDATLRQAVEHVRQAGLVMLVGEAGGRVPFGFALVPYETHLTSSVWGSLEDLKHVLGLARRGELTWDVEPMPLTDANEALARLRSGNVTGRIVLTPDGPGP